MIRHRDDIVGVVLAGGRSSRMGRDKACLRVGRREMLARTTALAGTLLNRVWVVGRRLDEPLPGVEGWLLDTTPGLGPGGGILTALEQLQCPILALSLDLPLLDVPTLERLLAARDAREPGTLMTTYLQEETGFIEALVAVYEPEAAPVLAAALEQGQRKLSAIFGPEVRSHVVYSVRDQRPFFNVNCPADLKQARLMRNGVEPDPEDDADPWPAGASEPRIESRIEPQAGPRTGRTARTAGTAGVGPGEAVSEPA